MKTQIQNPASTGRVIGAAGLLAASLLVAGCVVTSVYPYYTEKDLVFDPAVVGDWADAGQTNTPAEFIRIERAGEKGYWVMAVGGDETNRVELHLFRLQENLFLDSCPTNRSLDFLPVHQVSKAIWRGPVMETANLDYDWLAKLLEQNPKAVRHLVLPETSGDDQKGRIVLTADTQELQRFIIKHVNDTNAWKQPTQWKRRA